MLMDIKVKQYSFIKNQAKTDENYPDKLFKKLKFTAAITAAILHLVSETSEAQKIAFHAKPPSSASSCPYVHAHSEICRKKTFTRFKSQQRIMTSHGMHTHM